MPKFRLEDIEDYYAYYVLILGIPEDVFWNTDTSFVQWVAEDRAAYENWRAASAEERRGK